MSDCVQNQRPSTRAVTIRRRAKLRRGSEFSGFIIEGSAGVKTLGIPLQRYRFQRHFASKFNLDAPFPAPVRAGAAGRACRCRDRADSECGENCRAEAYRVQADSSVQDDRGTLAYFLL